MNIESIPSTTFDYRDDSTGAGKFIRKFDGVEAVERMLIYLREQSARNRNEGNRHYWDGVLQACDNFDAHCFIGVRQHTRPMRRLQFAYRCSYVEDMGREFMDVYHDDGTRICRCEYGSLASMIADALNAMGRPKFARQPCEL